MKYTVFKPLTELTKTITFVVEGINLTKPKEKKDNEIDYPQDMVPSEL
jgi:hypothetical protein